MRLADKKRAARGVLSLHEAMVVLGLLLVFLPMLGMFMFKGVTTARETSSRL